MQRMFRILRLSLVIIAMLYPLNQVFAGTAETPENNWQFLRWGIDYQVFHLTNPRPVNIFVARLHRAADNAIIDTGIAQGSIANGGETVRGMFDRYNQAINYWGSNWGGRNDVAVAINGYFFDTSSGPPPTYTPWGGVINSGWYAHRFVDFVGDAGFGWTLNRQAFIGNCVFHTSGKQYVTYIKLGSVNTNIRGVNRPRGGNELVLYTPQYDSSTGTDNSGVEYLVEMSRPTLVLPGPNKALGVVKEIRDQQGNTNIPFDHVVLSATGDVRDTMLGKIDVGDQIGITQEISNCGNPAPSIDWTKTYASLGGDYHFLTAGVPRTSFNNQDAYVANSRTAIAYNQDYVFFIVVDAFNPNVSEGLAIVGSNELTGFVQNILQATDAVSLDSGTSSAMVINGQVVNNIYCNWRNCGLPLDQVPPEVEITPVIEQSLPAYEAPASILAPEVCPNATCESIIGSSIMMINNEPISTSLTFTPTQMVTTTAVTGVRFGPGGNYANYGNVAANTQGVIIPHMDDLNGVLAKGSFWWKVDFGNLVGWVKEEALQGGTVPPPPPPPPPQYAYNLFFPSIMNSVKVTTIESPVGSGQDLSGGSLNLIPNTSPEYTEVDRK